MAFTIEDYSDRELLLIVDDVAAEREDLWVFAHEVHERLALEWVEMRSVSVRFSWLVRYGALEREHLRDSNGNLLYTAKGNPRLGQRWRLTTKGRALAKGTLTANQKKALSGITEDQLLVLAREIGTRQRQTKDQVVADLTRREWRYSTSALRDLEEQGT
jgi:hypothetical protein